MGRKKKYNTIEEKRQAQRENQMRHYWNNAERLRKEGLEKLKDSENLTKKQLLELKKAKKSK